MDIADNQILFSDTELKELFELFSSCSEYELNKIYDTTSDSYFEHTDLSEEYQLCLPKREFALDAVRSVLYFLNRRGYKLERNGEVNTLEGIKFNYIE